MKINRHHPIRKTGQRYRRVINRNSIFTQLVLFTVIVGLVPILSVSSIMFKKISNMATEQLIDSQSQLTYEYQSSREEHLLQYSNSLRRIADNTIIRNNLMDKEGEKNPFLKGSDVSTEVNKSLNIGTHTDIRNCMVYSNEENGEIYGIRVAMMDSAGREAWYVDNQKYQNGSFIYTPVTGNSNVLSLIQNIVYTDTITFQQYDAGFIKLDISMDEFFEPYADTEKETYPYDVVVLNGEGSVVYSSDSGNNDVLEELPFDRIAEKKVGYYRDKMVSTGTMEDYGLRLIYLFENSQLIAKRAEVQKAVFPVVLLMILVIIVLGFFFTRKFSWRVEKLVKKFQVAETGDLTITEEIGGNDEIALLDRQFNQMLGKLDSLIQKNYRQEIEKKEAEFRNLQLQINPHFLYNTLETISSIGAQKQMFVVCDICEKLGAIFRYSLGKNYGDYVTVAQELQHTKNYLYIQQARFGDKFEVFYNVAPQMEEKKILRFILQPIVENAIIHGISKMQGKGMLEISVTQDKGMLLIRIEDDGVGMSEMQMKEINRSMNSEGCVGEEDRKSIGIRNVNRRIKLAYGNEYGIMCESTENMGSLFLIRLPGNKEE